jgi:spore coat polysaccharide biosynthesis protein SpsF (cytidylyltransferase family)
MILAVLQARTSSRRLPEKVLKPILGLPMLARQIERLQHCRSFDALVVATSTEPADDAIAQIAKSCGVQCHRGSLDDVLDRLYQAALPYQPSHVVRLTGDCPLVDWDVVDRVVGFTIEHGLDYGSNSLKPTWPDGLDVETFAFSALEIAWREATSSLDREHVGPFITRSPERFRLGSIENDHDLSGLRWTVDEPADLEFVQRIYEELYPRKPAFTTDDILALLSKRPDVMAINAAIKRNEGLLQQSRRADG